MTQPEKIDYIVSGSCKYFGITKADLLTKPGTRSPVWTKKRYIAHILSEYTACTMSDIVRVLEYGQYTNAKHHMSAIINELSQDIYGCKKTKMVYNELLAYLNLES